MNKITTRFSLWAGVAALFLATLMLTAPSGNAASRAAAPQNDAKYEAFLNKEVRHELLMVPWYNVFDNLGYSVDGDEVTLTGQVVNPTVKSDAVASVKHIEGVSKVVDNISVLPPSPFDNQIRRAEYRAIFSLPSLSRYSMGVNPAIHIIVDSGRVTLEGYVDNQTDFQLATIRANSVPNVFSVTNHLKVG